MHYKNKTPSCITLNKDIKLRKIHTSLPFLTLSSFLFSQIKKDKRKMLDKAFLVFLLYIYLQQVQANYEKVSSNERNDTFGHCGKQLPVINKMY